MHKYKPATIGVCYGYVLVFLNSNYKLNKFKTMLSDEEKEKIDYKISQERKEKEANMQGWIYACMLVLILIAGLKGCAELCF